MMIMWYLFTAISFPPRGKNTQQYKNTEYTKQKTKLQNKTKKTKKNIKTLSRVIKKKNKKKQLMMK